MEATGSESHTEDGSSKVKAKYIAWTVGMDNVLTGVLTQQVNIGNRAKNIWRPAALEAATKAINKKFHIGVTKENIRSRLKTWAKHYRMINKMLKQDGFKWDNARKMIQVDNDKVWNAFVRSHKNAQPYRWKVIENWDDLHLIVGHDHMTGECAEADVMIANEVVHDDDQVGDAVGQDEIGVEVEVNALNEVGGQQSKERSSSTSVSRPVGRKAIRAVKKARGSSDALVSAMTDMANTFKSILDERRRPKSRASMVYDEVCKIPDLDEDMILEAIDLLIADNRKMDMFFSIPVEVRRRWLLKHIPRRSDEAK